MTELSIPVTNVVIKQKRKVNLKGIKILLTKVFGTHVTNVIIKPQDWKILKCIFSQYMKGSAISVISVISRQHKLQI